MKVYQSMKFKIVIMVAVICAFLAITINVYTIHSSKGNYREVTHDYLYDLAVSNGRVIETVIAEQGEESALSGDVLARTLEGVGLSGVESSYAYIVNGEGTMLYHPTAEKIGKPVENEVVSNLVADLQKGITHDPDVVEYIFKDAQKYASYYMNEDGKFILVISADEKEVMEPFNKIIALSTGIALLMAAIAIVIAFIIMSKMMAPLTYANSSVNAIADLDFRVTDQTRENAYLQRTDEIGSMLRATVELRSKLVDVVNGLKQQSNALYAASDSLFAAAQNTASGADGIEQAVMEIAEGATAQAGDTQKATADVVAIGNMVEKTNSNVVVLKNNADDIERLGYSASDTLAELETVNDKAKTYIEEIYEQTNNTNASVMKISNAVQLITSIAEETNLLSLNASIEAARAGEQGKGFAVVAAQIQKLAEQSNESAQEIENIIRDLMADSEKAVGTMDDVKKIMLEQSEKMEKTDQIFADVLKGIIQSKDGIQSIAENTRQMDISKEGIVDVVENLSAVAEENAASTQETSASVTEMGTSIQEVSSEADRMKEIAAELEKRVNMFKM